MPDGWPDGPTTETAPLPAKEHWAEVPELTYRCSCGFNGSLWSVFNHAYDEGYAQGRADERHLHARDGW